MDEMHICQYGDEQGEIIRAETYVSTRSGEQMAHMPPEKPNRSHHMARQPRVMVR